MTEDTGEKPTPEEPDTSSEHKTPLDALSREWTAKLEHREKLAYAAQTAQAALAAWDQELLDHARQVRGLADSILASHPAHPVVAQPDPLSSIPPASEYQGRFRRTLSPKPQSPESPYPGWQEQQGGGPDLTGQPSPDTLPMPQYDTREAPTQPMERMDPPARGTHRAGDGRGRRAVLGAVRMMALASITVLITLIAVVLVFPHSVLAGAIGHDLVPFGRFTAVLLVPLAVELPNPLQRWLGYYWRWLRATIYAMWALAVMELLMLHALLADVIGGWYLALVVVAGFVHNERQVRS